MPKIAKNKMKCWYCGKVTMEPFETYFKCASCGATHVPRIKLGPPAVTEPRDHGLGRITYSPFPLRK